MSVHIRELRGQSLDGEKVTRRYIMGGFATIDLVIGRIQSFPNPTIGSPETEIPYNTRSLVIQMPPTITEMGGGWWEVSVDYGPRNPQAVDVADGGATATASNHGDSDNETPIGPELSFTIATQSVPIVQSIKTRQSKIRDGATQSTPRNWQRAIGVDPKTGEVKGTEKYTAAMKQTLAVELPAQAVTPAYLRLLEDLTGKVNSHRFFGYDAGEVLFMGVPTFRNEAQGSVWKAQFDFAILRNKESYEVYFIDLESGTDFLILEDVHGWSHVWVTYQDATQDIDGVKYRTTIPLEAYEEQIYEYKDLRLMGLSRRKATVIT
jgi:hypothetical protein